MHFFDQVTGNDMNRMQKAFELRAQQLPESYQAAWREVNQQIWQYSDFSGRQVYPILEDVLALFEESAGQDVAIGAVMGADSNAFIAEIVQAAGVKNGRQQQRERLNRRVAKRLGK